MRRQSRWTALIGCAIALITGSRSLAQIPQGGAALEESGVVTAARQDSLQMKNAAGDLWLVLINRDTKVRIDGTAEAEYLHPGVSVRLTAETDKKGAIKDELHDLEIYTPARQDYGVFASEEAEKPLKSMGDGGKYYIKGQVQTYKSGTLTLKAGNKKITGKLAANPSIKVNASDPALAQPEDNVKVSGWYFQHQKAGPNKPGTATGTEVSVTFAKPLSGAKKATKSAKAVRSSARTGSGNGKARVQDPFAPPAEKKK